MPQSVHRDFFYFYINSPKATKKSFDKTLVEKVILLVTGGFDPLVWDAYNANNSISKKAILNLIAHFIESKGAAFADQQYILHCVEACFRGDNLNLEFPAIFTTAFGVEFGRIHSSRYGHVEGVDFDKEIPVTVSTEEIFLPNVRGYKLNLNIQHLQKYMAIRKGPNIMLQANFFNGAAFKLIVTATSVGGGDTLSYKFKAKRCNLNHRINGLNVIFDVI